ncbi:MAG: LysM peptidoglycan-binding domain-containing protein [Vicinamibacteria bacterium]|nr:LysM peptidoglycan-binding domain-containing protein [Vicinamibacteria bacterium]
MKNLSALALASCCVFSPLWASAQTHAIPPSGQYVVQPGDTLESLARKFLGAANRWQELQAANPESARDPYFLRPGSKIRIAEGISARRATIQQVFRQVERMPFPSPWTPASVGGVLQPRDGIRTFEKSSSELQFDNDTRMVVSEESVVFLREPTPTPENVSRRSIEIRAGQADLDLKQKPTGAPNAIEFHIGDTTGTARPGSSGNGASRARRSADGGSRIMVYDGDGEVTAAGRSVPVPGGMGIAVTAEGKHNGPESLLGAPRPLSPNESDTFDFSNPTFDWEPVSGATSYTVEVCRDVSCGQLVDRASGISLTRWTPRVLPIGVLYWRVAAVSASGLDGFLSPAQKFTIRTFWRRPVDRP